MIPSGRAACIAAATVSLAAATALAVGPRAGRVELVAGEGLNEPFAVDFDHHGNSSPPTSRARITSSWARTARAQAARVRNGKGAGVTDRRPSRCDTAG
ncbi:MAG: hypothetical protein DMF78_11940 [Acidobacteria bacterium]|nr:MAG: hypothetical protein DMF78_11940 [Acidobacteriota bacterium]